ncbi:MAG: 16S rRNA (cytidine(1402)-2'-O)-methyltransferase [Armatimonadetes bacterium]|nr:16S rRNA (cytidine(1402)-2'-O)-methyltransferase [Armatimonadota bacterium]
MAKLWVVASPIGNLGDLSPRSAEVLTACESWWVEDSRVSSKLASHLGVKKSMRVMNDHTSETQIARWIDELEGSDQEVAILSDGGAPGVSDPGSIAVDLALEAGIEVGGIPGPSAPTLALMLSGFFAQRYAFLGFLPRKPGPMRELFEPFADSAMTLVCFESPFRIDALLKVAGEALGDRRYAICREMTKSFEQVFRAKLPTIPTEAQVPRKGEFTVVIEGRRKKFAESE